LIGTLTLAGDGNPNDLWIFQIAGQLTTANGAPSSPAASVVVTDTGADAGVYFEVGSLATLGNDTSFEGNILAGSGVTLDPGAQITCGRAFAQTAVTFAGDDPAASGGQPNLVDSSDCSAISSTGFNGGTITGGMVTPSVVTPVPEPGSMALLGSGLCALAGVARRKLRK
jgi:type VI secretion system secreted protein VgrG